jgi:hypothetical protein
MFFPESSELIRCADRKNAQLDTNRKEKQRYFSGSE